MTKYIFIIYIPFLLIQFQGCADISIQKQLKNNLCEAYYDDSETLLKTFFEQWEKEIKPITGSELKILSDTLHNVYTIYDVYCNYELEKYPQAFRDCPYYIIQNEIKYTISDQEHISYPIPDSTIILSKQITNFRPFPQNINKKYVYASSLYKAVLESFITDKHGEEKKSKYYNNPWPGWPRANFLEQIVQLRAGLLGFHYYTLPYISLDFNKNMNEVIIESRLGNTWTSELFILKNDVWVYRRSYNFSIE